MSGEGWRRVNRLPSVSSHFAYSPTPGISSGFSLSTLHLKKGIPVRWKIYGDQVSSCTNKIIVPSLNISKKISNGENVVEFIPDTVGEIPFSCWMGMTRGKFIVE